MISRLGYLKIILLIVCFLTIKTFSQKQESYLFDFGSNTSPLNKYSILVDSTNIYSKQVGYGLLSKVGELYYDTSLEKLTNKTTCDGIIVNGEIVFRVDLKPGDYIIEILMHGGKRTTWEGEININDEVVAKRLLCYSANYEGENPPPYWGIVAKINNKRDGLIIKVKAEKQPTTISGISIYSADFGMIKFSNGKFIANKGTTAPNSSLALELINKAKIVEAKKIIDAMPVEFRFEKALLLFSLASRIEVANPRDYIETAFYYLKDEAEINPTSKVLLNLRLAELMLNANQFYNIGGWMWNKELYPNSGLFNYTNIAGDSYEAVSAIEDHPLYLAATWLKAKTAYWIYIEQHEKELQQLADKYFATLKKYFPNNDLLNEYMGLLKYDVSKELKTSKIPEWAFLQNKVVSTMLNIINYWVETRQAENGEFGGKYDDDVEMLRWWPISRIAFNDSTALKGMKKIVDGIWNSDWIYKGFSKKVRDVEHSSEPVADTQPMMIGLDYGNPIYVERCMESVKGLRDLWTGINSKGHRHFKSSWYSSTQIDTEPPKDCDLEMNTRTVKAAIWLAWYNRHPFVMQFLKEWGDAWLEDCMRTEKGKPKGVVPAAIRFNDDAIGGHADNWHHPNMFWDYFNYRGGAKMLMQFLITSILLEDDKYLEPLTISLDLLKKHRRKDLKNAVLGSEEYAVSVMQNSKDFWEAIELWRLYKNNNKYDDLIKEVGSPYLKYYLTKNENELSNELAKTVNEMINNYNLNTSEGYFTDRIDLGDMRKQDSNAGGLMEAMYTGSSLASAEFPFNRITWTGFSSNLSAMVMQSGSNHIKLKTYLHSQSNCSGEITFLDFKPGKYEMKVGKDSNGDLIADVGIITRKFSIASRNSSVGITLTGATEQIIEINLLEKAEAVGNTILPDLAITKEELIVVRSENTAEVEIPIHNIGIADATNITCSISYLGVELSRKLIEVIKAPLDLEPKIEKLIFKLDKPSAGKYKITVQSKINSELNFKNNEISFSL